MRWRGRRRGGNLSTDLSSLGPSPPPPPPPSLYSDCVMFHHLFDWSPSLFFFSPPFCLIHPRAVNPMRHLSPIYLGFVPLFLLSSSVLSPFSSSYAGCVFTLSRVVPSKLLLIPPPTLLSYRQRWKWLVTHWALPFSPLSAPSVSLFLVCVSSNRFPSRIEYLNK